jgi:GH15 family glucan-1,4-alpha-glucosidase
MSHRYKPISDYGAIGNLRTMALVARDGSIDWWCTPDLGSPSVFAALLDRDRGGAFRVWSPGARSQHEYVRHTNVLETRFESDAGALTVVDFMPVEGILDGCGGSRARPEIHRLVEARRGRVDVVVEWAPRLDYARAATRIELTEQGAIARGDEATLVLSLDGLPEGAELTLETAGDGGPAVRVQCTLDAGSRMVAVSGWADRVHADVGRSLRARDETCEAWLAWVHKPELDRGWAGRWKELVIRSELVLKLLTHADTGAIAAAATTSLPEEIGGVRNWDYRYVWIRDAAMAAQALFAAGHGAEARAFLHFAERSAEACEDPPGVRVLYGLRGETELTESELDHFEGYRGSRPVRIGNEAASQKQLDIYGELLDGAYAMVREGDALASDVVALLARVADRAANALLEPDDGIWELRNGPHLFTYSQLMLWTALDRAVILAERGLIHGDVERWRGARDRAQDLVLERGFDAKTGAFTRTFDGDALDASSLLVGVHELLPFDDPRVRSTIDRTREGLEEDGLVYRYKADDGLPGGEGAFVLCTCWLIDALTLSGRVDEAESLFERLVARASPLGLFAEQLDPKTGEHLGNYPQAFSHIGVIGSALHLAYARGRELPVPPPLGTREHRAEVERHRRRSTDR